MKFVLASYGTRAMSSLAPPSAVNCYAAGTKCAWPSRPTWLASSRRLGLRRSLTDWIRRRCGSDFLATSGRVFPQPLEDPGSDQVMARNSGSSVSSAGRR